MKSLFRRTIGQILVDGNFVSPGALERALDEQKRTKELLGEVLVRMGVLRETDIKAPLLIQGHLNHIEDAVKLAAGERQLLGALLVHSGHISHKQLDQAIAEQKRTGEKLGEVFLRLGMLTQPQLQGLLDLQQNQTQPSDSPLRLGELLVATGHITREQLDRALTKQAHTGGKLGEVLVSEGYLKSSQVSYGIRLQKMLVNSVVAAILSLGISTAASAATVHLEWDASADTTVVGYKVHYQADSSVQPFQGTPVDAQAATSIDITDVDPGREHHFAVTAYDTEGVESVYSNVITIAESLPPSTGITSPAPSAAVSGIVNVTADAADNVGVAKVEFYVNDVLQASSDAPPYYFAWDTTALPQGSYTLTSKAYDAAGNVGQSQSVTVTVASDAVLPTVTLASPENNTTQSGTVTISADAADNVAVSKVEFYLNGALLSASNMAPYAYNWDTKSVPNGIYTVTAQAFDSAGNAGLSQVVTVNVSNDLVAPTVNLTSPGSSATVSGTVTVAAAATDNVWVSKVEFYRNGALVATSNAAPYSYSWDTKSVPNGSYTLAAKAYDAAGNIGQSQASTIIVSNDYTAPTVALTAPSTVSGTATLSATAADELGVSRVEFYRDGVLMGSANTAPYSYSWNTKTVANGTYQITAKAYDAAGNVGVSPTSSVTVENDMVAPTVAITSPSASSTVGGTVGITATAADNVGVARVEFWINGKLQASTNASPYTYFWNTKSVPNGSYTLTTRAYDDAGNVSQSAAVTITVKNTSGNKKK